MKISLLFGLLFCFGLSNFVQAQSKHNKGKFYVFWGWNRAEYSKSDIRFTGDNYDFTLYDVKAQDRPTSFGMVYINPSRMTIPQYNFRLGYFFHDNWNISIGTDHMKYVMSQNQGVKISGTINEEGNPYNGVYDNDNIYLTENFLQFEHTDGLNYANIELRRFDNLAHLSLVKSGNGIDFNITEGAGAGVLYPRTNTTLMGKERYDEFHLAGWGTAAVVGLNVTFFNKIFAQTELKGGYINMNDIRTTESKSDKAKQNFFFAQHNLVFGAVFGF